MSQKLITIDWNLQARVESWNLIVGIAKSMRLSLSPVATTSFFTLSDFLQKKIPTEYSLVVLCVTSLFIGTKSEYKDMVLDKFIDASSRFVKNLNHEQKKLFDEESVSILASNDRFNAHKIKSSILKCEIVILTYNNWEFVTYHPFTPLLDWLSEVRAMIREGGANEEREQKFRAMRSTAVKYICVLIVYCEEQIKERIISGASLTQALIEHPDVIPEIPVDKWKETHVSPEENEQITELSSLIHDFQQRAGDSLIASE